MLLIMILFLSAEHINPHIFVHTKCAFVVLSGDLCYYEFWYNDILLIMILFLMKDIYTHIFVLNFVHTKCAFVVLSGDLCYYEFWYNDMLLIMIYSLLWYYFWVQNTSTHIFIFFTYQCAFVVVLGNLLLGTLI